MSAFALAVDTLFADPTLARDAIWRTGGAGDGFPVRVIRKRPDEVVGFGDGRAVLPAVLVDVRRSDVVEAAKGDTVEIEGETFAVIGTPLADTERLVWTCEASIEV